MDIGTALDVCCVHTASALLSHDANHYIYIRETNIKKPMSHYFSIRFTPLNIRFFKYISICKLMYVHNLEHSIMYS